MKYILKNIRTFYDNERLIFALTIICIFFSAIVLNFFYGIYHEFEQRVLNNVYGTEELGIYCDRLQSRPVYKGELVDAVLSINENLEKGLESIIIEGHFPEDKDSVENRFSFYFCLENGKITYAREIFDIWRTYGFWREGEYFSKSQYENGELVALVGIKEEYQIQEDNTIMVDEHYQIHYGDSDLSNYKYQEKDGYVTVDGKKYRCIGVQEMTLTPCIPITTVKDDFIVSDIALYTYGTMTKQEYTTIVDVMKGYFGDAVEIPDYPIPESGTQRLYHSVLVVCILIAVMSAAIYTVLYQYILYQRKKNLTVFRICGFTLEKARKLYLAECLLFAAVCYIGAVAVFHYLLLPWLQDMYLYLWEVYSPQCYLKLAGLYFVSIYLMLRGMIKLQLHKKIKDGI